MNASVGTSRLYYHGTDTEVCLGDRVKVKRFLPFRRPREGQVAYIPGLCPAHPDIDDDAPGAARQWAIELADGSVLVMVYWPPRVQPRKNIIFVRRGTPKPFPPTRRLY